VTADSNNRVQEVTDYAPFGAINNHDQLAGYSEERKFTGQEYDSTTNLNYMNARSDGASSKLGFRCRSDAKLASSLARRATAVFTARANRPHNCR
jgi:hypothetical protein